MKWVQPIVDRLYRIPLGFVNAFVIARPGQLTLVDCGMPGDADRIERAIREVGADLNDLRHILVTHCHPDHSGSLAEIQRRAPNSRTWMHAEDAALVRQGVAIRAEPRLRPSPGLHNYLLYHLFARRIPSRITPARVDHHVCDGQYLNIAGGIRVIHAPGHSRGQVCFLWKSAGGVLFAADTASCVFGPAYSIAYEDFELGKQTLCDLGMHPFEYACFGHGQTLMRAANRELCRAFASHRKREFVPAPEPG